MLIAGRDMKNPDEDLITVVYQLDDFRKGL